MASGTILEACSVRVVLSTRLLSAPSQFDGFTCCCFCQLAHGLEPVLERPATAACQTNFQHPLTHITTQSSADATLQHSSVVPGHLQQLSSCDMPACDQSTLHSHKINHNCVPYLHADTCPPAAAVAAAGARL